MNGLIVKKTQSTLGKVIKKPALTEKLLSKPPFRYLHDIFTEIIRTTGFMKGLYKEYELKSECIKDKEMKMAFLQKAIDVVVLVTGEPLAVRPAQIVAGHEPEKTNELLQAIAKCCLNKISSKEAVKRVLAGERLDVRAKESALKSQDKDAVDGREPQPDREEKKMVEHSECRVEKEREQPREQERPRRDAHDRERSAKNHRREQETPKDVEQDKCRKRERDRDHDDAQANERERDKDQEKESGKREKVKSTESERHKPSVSQNQSPTRTSQPSSARGQRWKNTLGDESDGEGNIQKAQIALNKESGDAAVSSLSSDVPSSNRTVRPSSARPAPPRVKKQESFSDGVPAERLSSAKSSVIREGKKLSADDDEEDEQFLVAEAAPEPADPADTESTQEVSTEEKHGGLVKKILETKKDYESSPCFNKSNEKLVSEEARKKEQDLVTREIERLRASIQSVCQSALPLGKIMDYVQEDIDAMQAELQSWRKENKEHAQVLLQEQKVTDQAVEPLKAELGELDQQMKDYQDKICAVRSNILMNEENIQKKLAAIISSRF
ncbi:TRAF3-interacting protein 1-like isoform X2 [Syngnathoides biaculeatus]|uniref:TRAF3-interacting protein 1-like isoform X2 n=1 Tax=Syngnathoides biaculeatus TaxID=300417 RepID=UPI002ADD62FC|nr:TRAF3-interacting protein 1-like isoform X2 [Syngnathoides biaculeatus]